jgi:hypothetical protein
VTWAAILLLSIVLLALAARWFVNANPASLAQGMRLGAIWLAVIVVLAMAATGRLPWLMGVIAPLIPVLIAILARARQRHRPAADWGAEVGQRSNVTTDFLDMTFDHDSGELDGRVTAGAFKDRTLSSMSLDEHRTLLREVKAAQDTNSLNVLVSFLERTYGDGWREDQDSGSEGEEPQPSASGAMTRDEAWRVLGLEPGASDEEIRSAHRNLMKQLHPDRGGSGYLAAKVNEAKDLLLGR